MYRSVSAASQSRLATATALDLRPPPPLLLLLEEEDTWLDRPLPGKKLVSLSARAPCRRRRPAAATLMSADSADGAAFVSRAALAGAGLKADAVWVVMPVAVVAGAVVVVVAAVLDCGVALAGAVVVTAGGEVVVVVVVAGAGAGGGGVELAVAVAGGVLVGPEEEAEAAAWEPGEAALAEATEIVAAC